MQRTSIHREERRVELPVMKKNVKGAILAVLGGACWGLSGSCGQYLFTQQGMDSKWLVPIRLGCAGILIFLYCMFRYGRKQTFAPWQNKTNARDLLIYGLLGISLCQFLYFLTIQLSSAGAATILQDLSPIFILLVTCMLEKRRPDAKEVGAIVLAMTGVVLITTHGSVQANTVPLPALLSGIACAFCVMIYNVEPKQLLEQFPVTILQGWAFLMGGVFFALVFHVWTISYVPTMLGILGIVFVVLVGNVIAFTCYIEGVHLIGPSKAILYGFSEPVTAALVTFLFMGSPFTLWDAVGFLCVFLMLVLISKK
jgi:drug/metabolite transporter (DMT)-like permease